MAPAPHQPHKKRSPRRRNLIRKTEVRRALTTARAAGFSIQRIDVEPSGKFSVVLGPLEPGDRSPSSGVLP